MCIWENNVNGNIRLVGLGMGMVLKLMGMGRNGKAESHSRTPLLLIRTVDCSVLMIVRSSSFSLSTRNTG